MMLSILPNMCKTLGTIPSTKHPRKIVTQKLEFRNVLEKYSDSKSQHFGD